ncbi:hypothetical protein GCM10009677_20260 [Sphaerisporangium rubeum]|uniref:DUF4158 domain-containing protein n=1 Tax=Sphaerisporangium rubeum TaxID=321317 RepID=A0A7X0M736_9ACTN|nr:DUF4158 domain-containing protein [Sphaerisporangium rubeum]MBB6473897.1 hypothetical protein [Sphaerisporangium rubeum]
MPFEFLSDEQIARYGRFPEEPSAAELEQFFRLDRSAWDALASQRRKECLVSLAEVGVEEQRYSH